MNKRKTIILLVIGILIVLTLSIGVTYSYMKPKVDKTNNETEIGINNCANLTLKEKNKTINLTNMYPMEEEMALQKDAYEFTISNTCEEYTGFSLYLTTLNENEIEDSNIRYAITDLGNNVLISDVLSEKLNGISDFNEEELKQLDTEINGTHKNIYKIYGSTISIKRINKYKLYLWVDENAGNETMGKSFTVGLTTKLSEEEKNYVKDLSGNNYDGVMQNGALIKLDNEGRQGLYFDGEDDYVDIVDLPETINWSGGFTIEFEAKWLAFQRYSRIFDFGNGARSNNIFVSNTAFQNILAFETFYNNEEYFSRKGDLEQDKIEKIKLVFAKVEDGYQLEICINGNEALYTKFNINTIRNIKRTSNYLGKSNWESADEYFKGYIYNLKITDANGNIILWYDFTNETIKDLSGNGNYGIIYGQYVSWNEEGITLSNETKSSFIDCGLDNYDFKNSISLISRVRLNYKMLHYFISNADGGGFSLSLNSNNTFGELGTLDFTYYYFNKKFNYDVNKFYTLVMTYDGNNYSIYIDGIKFESISATGNIKVLRLPILIGSNPNANGSYESREGNKYSLIFCDNSRATFADALIFDRALTEDEIAKDYGEEINPTNKQDLLLWYKFD